MSRQEILDARRLLRARHSAALGTLSSRLAGHPFVTSVDYLCDHAGRPLFLVSALAEHSRNMAVDPRVSLLVQDTVGEAQASPRLTLVGVAQPLAMDHCTALKARYLRYFTSAEPYFELDFHFCLIEPTQLRYIGGFGAARWIAPGDFLTKSDDWTEAEDELVAQFPNLIGLDCDGFDFVHDQQLRRHDFDEPLDSPEQARVTLVDVFREMTP